MKTPEKADDPLAAIATRILELSLTCAPRSKQRLALVHCYSHAMMSAAIDEEPSVETGPLRSLAMEARDLLPTATTDDIRSVSIIVEALEREAAAVERRAESRARMAAHRSRLKAKLRSQQSAANARGC
jgi:hypothetical protein